MARPRKIGLEYFPLDTMMFSDIKLRKLIRCQGGKAITVYVCLLCIIYESGYYIRWDEDLLFIISERTGYEEAYIQEVLKSCLAVGLFDKAMWADGVLTSRGIQYRYLEVTARRTNCIKEYSLVSATETHVSATETHVSATETPVNVTETHVSATLMPQRKENKSKENNKESSSPPTTPARASVREEAEADDESRWHDELTKNQLFIESAMMRFKLPRDAVLRALADLKLECQAKGKRHQDWGDYRAHAFDYLRIWANDKGKQQPATTTGKGVGVMAIPTDEERRAEAEHKAGEERLRVLGIYNKALEGDKRMCAIVQEMQANGTLAKYGKRWPPPE